MKRIFLIISTILLLLLNTVKAANYYVSAAGSDTAAGTSAEAAWQTLSKVYSFALYSNGDSVLFKRGDTFYGTLNVKRENLNFGAYGNDANPVITGLTNVTAWTNLRRNIWESTSAVSTLTACNIVVINTVNTAMGRIPNTGYYALQSHNGNTSITSSSLSGKPNWTGAELAIKTFAYVIDRLPITAQTASTLTFGAGISGPPMDGAGFFIQNDSRTLDVQNEWYYNPSTKKIRIYSISRPTNVQVSTVDTLFNCHGRDNVSVSNIQFVGSNKISAAINYSLHPKILNCQFNYAGIDAIRTDGGTCDNTKILNCSINNTNNNAVNLGGSSAGCIVSYDTIKNTGMLPGMSPGGGAQAVAIQTHSDGNTISNCIIDSVGYNGIEFYGSNTSVINNFIQHHCGIKIDGAGIYTYVSDGSHPYSNQKVLNNIVGNSLGSIEGTGQADLIVHGIYMDDGTTDVEIFGNTLFNNVAAGLYLHNTNKITIVNNNLFNNSKEQALFVSSQAGYPLRNTIFKHNNLVAKKSTQLAASFETTFDDISSFGTFDSNIIARPIDDNLIINTSINSYATNVRRSLAGWQSYSGFDVHSTKSPFSVSDVNDLKLVYNATNAKVSKSLSFKYRGTAQSPFYSASIPIGAYSSYILLNNGVLDASSGKVLYLKDDYKK